MDPDRARTLAELRKKIGAPGPAVQVAALPTQIPDLDAAIGGWPNPGIVELSGRAGAGRLALLMPTLSALARKGLTVGVVDPLGRIYPPGWPAAESLLIAQPAPEQAAWTAEQMARSGAIAAVVMLELSPPGAAGARLSRACEQGGCTLFVLSERQEPRLPAAVRVAVEGRDEGQVWIRVIRRRGGPGEQRLAVRLS